MIHTTYEDYIADVRAGTRVEGELMKLCVERFCELRGRDDIEFKAERVERVISYYQRLRHFKGKTAGSRFILEPWQQFVMAYIFGLYKDGKRLVRDVYIEIARKNGKTALAAGMGTYMALGDGEMGAEVDLAANSREQAMIDFEFCEAFSRQLDRKEVRLKAYRNKVKDKKTKSKLIVFSSDTKAQDGYDASCYILDEYHSAVNSAMRDLLASSQGTRDQPLGIVITTAGFDKLGPCYKLRTMCVELLHKAKTDDTQAAFIFSMDEGDKWDDPTVWCKSNPNMGVTVTTEYIANQVNKARNLDGSEVGVRTKNLNQWCDSSQVWIPDDYIVRATADVKPWEMPDDIQWYGGIDLSATTDLTAIGLCGIRPGEKKIHLWVHYFLPVESLNTSRFKILYGDWSRRGALTLTPGNVTDYDIILEKLRWIQSKCCLLKVGYDSWNATQFVINAENAGLPMEPYSQTIGNFNRPTKEFERLMLSGQVAIDNNVINRHCVRNVALAVDRNGNTKPTKQYSEKKIDGVIVMLEALGMMLQDDRAAGGLY